MIYRGRFGSTFAMTLKNIYLSDGTRVTDAAAQLGEVEFQVIDDERNPLLLLTRSGGRCMPLGDFITWKVTQNDYENLQPNRIYHASVRVAAGDEYIPHNITLYFENNVFSNAST